MAYGLSTRALIEGASVEQSAKADLLGSAARWHALSEASRLELIEQALRAANDRIDGYPLAL
jgi:dihydrodipicolinate synthase/N-acetylneuraminate lyase